MAVEVFLEVAARGQQVERVELDLDLVGAPRAEDEQRARNQQHHDLRAFD